MAELEVERFQELAREVYRRKFGSVAPGSVVDGLLSAFFFGEPPAYDDAEAPYHALTNESDVRFWIDSKLNEYGYNPSLVGPPAPSPEAQSSTGVQADEAGADTDMGMSDFLRRQEEATGRVKASTGLPAWAWGAIAAGLVFIGFAMSGKGRAKA